MVTKTLVALVGAGLLVACSDGLQDPEAMYSVRITPESDTLNAIGDTVRLVAAVVDEEGRVIPSAPVEWTSLDGGIATAEPSGRVVGLAEGLARIRAASGAAADTAEVWVRAGVPTAEMQFLRFAANVVSRVVREGSFWAVKGEDRRLVLRYTPLPGESKGEEFLDFRVAAESLWKRPNGTTFNEGDSILITVAVDEETGFLFRFEPSGLRFDPERPARLKVTYRHAHGDLDGNGVIDDDDDELKELLAVWKQEQEGDPWLRLYSVAFEDLEEIEALIDGFTGFAMASN